MTPTAVLFDGDGVIQRAPSDVRQRLAVALDLAAEFLRQLLMTFGLAPAA
jgi:hypothetical protein